MHNISAEFAFVVTGPERLTDTCSSYI